MKTRPRILVNRLGALGDVILTTPIIRKIYQDRDGFCQIAVRTQHPEVFFDNPYVTAIKTLADELITSEFDIIFNLDLAYENNPDCHILDAYGCYVFGNTSFSRQCEIFPNADAIATALALVPSTGTRYLVIHMRRTVQNSRNLPEFFWKSIIEKLLSQKDVCIVQVGMPNEIAFGGDPRLIDLRGKLSIHALQKVIESSVFYIGVDSAPFHVAATTAVNMAIFFTTARAEFRRPFRPLGNFQVFAPNISCYGCQEKSPLGSTMVTCARGDEDCVNQFDLDFVLNSILPNI
jgi:ADP-heptose:LPS heptosyltransferase